MLLSLCILRSTPYSIYSTQYTLYSRCRVTEYLRLSTYYSLVSRGWHGRSRSRAGPFSTNLISTMPTQCPPALLSPSQAIFLFTTPYLGLATNMQVSSQRWTGGDPGRRGEEKLDPRSFEQQNSTLRSVPNEVFLASLVDTAVQGSS